VFLVAVDAVDRWCVHERRRLGTNRPGLSGLKVEIGDRIFVTDRVSGAEVSGRRTR
jgi:hypothetical protein